MSQLAHSTPSGAFGAGRDPEFERLLRRLRRLVAERKGDARARRAEIERLQQRLADVVRRDPVAGRDRWGRTR